MIYMIKKSTREQRLEAIEEMFACKHNCPICGNCQVLRGHEATEVFKDYIDGLREFSEISREWNAMK